MLTKLAHLLRATCEDGIVKKDGEEIGIYEYREDAPYPLIYYMATNDVPMKEQLDRETLERRGRESLMHLYGDYVTTSTDVTSVQVDDQYYVTLHFMHEQQRLESYGFGIVLRLDGVIEMISAPSVAYEIIPSHIHTTLEQLSTRVAEATKWTLRWLYVSQDDFVGGDDAYHLVYDVSYGMPIVEMNGEVQNPAVSELTPEEERWGELTIEWIRTHIHDAPLRVEHVLIEEESVHVHVSRTYKQLPVGDSMLVQWNQSLQKVEEAHMTHALYDTIDECAEPLVSLEDVKAKWREDLQYAHVWFPTEEVEKEGQLVQQFEQSFIQHNPPHTGNIQAYDAKTGAVIRYKLN